MIGGNQEMKSGNVSGGITSNHQGSEKLMYETTKKGYDKIVIYYY
jgi:hypothetical protein